MGWWVALVACSAGAGPATMIDDFGAGPGIARGVSVSTPFAGSGATYFFVYVAAGKLIIVIDNETGPDELWISEGTADTTAPFFTSAGPIYAAFGTEQGLFFSAFDPDHGSELWFTDGTAHGTRMVRDLNPGPGSGGPYGFTEIDGAILFTADDVTHGRELWISRGREADTYLLSDTIPGPASGGPAAAEPFGIHAIGEWILFDAVDPDLGRELFVLPRSALEPRVDPPAASDAGFEDANDRDAESTPNDAGPPSLELAPQSCGCSTTTSTGVDASRFILAWFLLAASRTVKRT